MPKALPSPPKPGRYTQERVALEIAERIAAGGRGTHKALAAALGLQPPQLSHRLAGTYSLTIEQIGQVADFFNAPPGWPFIPWHIGEAAFTGRGSR